MERLPDRCRIDAYVGAISEHCDHVAYSQRPVRLAHDLLDEFLETGNRDLPLEPTSLTGYCIMNAESLDDAEKLLKDCPIIHSVRIYEAASM